MVYPDNVMPFSAKKEMGYEDMKSRGRKLNAYY